MKARTQVYIIIAILLVVGLGAAAYKIIRLDYPLIPKDKVKVWVIEAQISFEATGEPVKVSFAVPGQQATMGVLYEEGASRGYGFQPPPSLTSPTLHRRVTWSKDKAEGAQTLFYRTEVVQMAIPGADKLQATVEPVPDWILEEPLASAADSVIQRARAASADDHLFVEQLSQQIGSLDPSQEMRMLLNGVDTDLKKARLLHALARKGDAEVHLVRGLELGESQRRQSLVPLLLVRQNDTFHSVVAGKPADSIQEPFLAWQRGGRSLVDVEGGENVRVRFSVLRDRKPALGTVERAAKVQNNPWVDFSIYSLPIDQQNAFRILLMVPLGALIVVIMRNLVGIKTSGTFMPILIGMAFLQTKLIPGFVIFFLIVSIGLLVRAYLSRLDLLLVPRISAVVIVVIGIMALASILGHKLDLAFAHSVTLFPTIILSWTVERLSILWEEDGGREVAVQTGGSLIVAVMAYFVMGSSTLQYITFTFPELLLVVLATILLLGQYTGYRLSELRRFEPMTVPQEEAS